MEEERLAGNSASLSQSLQNIFHNDCEMRGAGPDARLEPLARPSFPSGVFCTVSVQSGGQLGVVGGDGGREVCC